MIEFTDADGVKQTLDMAKPFNVAYHVDCMELLQSLPDKCFDLACVDPPYGDANVVDDFEHRNQRGRFDRYNDSSQIVQVERERERERRQAQIPRKPEEPERQMDAVRRGTDSAHGSTATRLLWRKLGGGQNDLSQSKEQEAHGRQSMPKKS